MIKYLKTKKYFFNKFKKNGAHKRTLHKYYNNKTKQVKHKKMIGGSVEPIKRIEESDIMYKNYDVCILKPNVKKGILIWSNYTQPHDMDSLCILGLKTGQQLSKEEVEFGRSVKHPYIFFRAPYYSRDIDYTSVETEITSSYGKEELDIKDRVYIRVDPDNTFVYSSEIRVLKPMYEIYDELENSRKTLTVYLLQIAINAEKYKTLNTKKKNYDIAIYDLQTSKLIFFEANPAISYKENIRILEYPMDTNPIEKHSEILVRLAHLTNNFFVLCTHNNNNNNHTLKKTKYNT